MPEHPPAIRATVLERTYGEVHAVGVGAVSFTLAFATLRGRVKRA